MKKPSLREVCAQQQKASKHVYPGESVLELDIISLLAEITSRGSPFPRGGLEI